MKNVVAFLMLPGILFCLCTSDQDSDEEMEKAIKAKDFQKVSALISAGADVNARARGHVPPLSSAAMWGTPEIARLLLERGANVNYRDTLTGQSALTIAAGFAPAETVGLLLERGAEVDVVETMSSYTALINAANSGRSDSVRLLLGRGAKVSLADRDGMTALHYAASHGKNPETARLLLEGGADVNARSKLGYTPLMSASYALKELVEVLLKGGADVNAKSSKGETALMFAAKRNRLDLARVLLDGGADVNAKSSAGDTALSLAETNEMIVLLRQAGALGDKMPVKVPAALNAEDIRFLQKECQIPKPDIDIIPMLKKEVKDILFQSIARRDIKQLESFKVSRAFLATLKAKKPDQPFPRPPSNWHTKYFTAEELTLYRKIVDEW